MNYQVEITPTAALKANLYRIKSELLYKGAEGKKIDVLIDLHDDTVDYINVYIVCERLGFNFSVNKKDYTEDMIDLCLNKVFPSRFVSWIKGGRKTWRLKQQQWTIYQ